jgi:serine protease Do
VIVERVEEASPAATAGVKRGDAILCVAGRNVRNPFDIERSLWERKPGEKLNLRVLRDGKEITLALTLGKK